MAGAADETVIDFARSERRLLLTEDKDFGQLVFAAAKQNSGVILIRYPASARSALSAAVLKLLSDSGESLYSWFAVLEPGRVRVTQLVTLAGRAVIVKALLNGRGRADGRPASNPHLAAVCDDGLTRDEGRIRGTEE